MLNNERKFPKREPVWKPLFDIFLCCLSFSVGKELSPGKAADEAFIPPGAAPTRPVKI
jgi:hypothetical protein